jgi:hypothetical protein
MRPALTAVADGREQRILAVLDHKPWNAEEGETWLAAFPCSTDPAALVQAELTVAPDVTVPLPPPSAPTTGRRPKRGASRRSSTRQQDTKVKDGGSNRGPSDRLGEPEDRLRLEYDAALRSRDEAVFELQTVKCLAAQTSHDRDEARAARDEAARERDEARAERDDVQRARNRMLAERDTARTRIEELTRQWELAAGLGTRRTVERDALAIERDRLARERDAALTKLESQAPPVAAERTPLVPPVQPIRRRDAAVGTGYVDGAPGAPSGRTHDAARMWRTRLLAVSALLVAVVILVVLLLAK